jgi:hypothetical protein
MDMVNKIYNHLERLPHQLQAEAFDFIEYLVFRNEQKSTLKEKDRYSMPLLKETSCDTDKQIPNYNHSDKEKI